MTTLAILGGEPLRRVPFSPWPQYTQADMDRLVRQVESRHWGGFPFPGRLASEFAERFAAMQGAKYGLCLANGTIAIHVALQAAGLAFGDEVIVPAYTWDGTATAVLSAGGVPVFADVDPDTYCLDIESVRRAITPRTRAIVPVHLAMRFTDMDALMDLAAAHHLTVIEDCAHAHGGQWRGRGAGAIGDIGCFSLQESKLLTAGEGGIVITSRLDYFEAMQTIVNCGRASLTDEFGIRMLGSNYRMTELQAALLIGQLEMLPGLRTKRAKHAALLSKLLAGIAGIRPLPAQPAISQPTYYTYVFQYRPDSGSPAPSRDLFAAALEKEGVPCDGRFYEAVYRSDLFYATPDNCAQLCLGREERVDYTKFHCPVTERAAYTESVWLPQTILIGDEQDVRDVGAAVEKVVANLEVLAAQPPELAGAKAMGRAQRARLERDKNY